MSNISDERLVKASIEGDTETNDILKNRVQTVVMPALRRMDINGSDEDVDVLKSQIMEKVLITLPNYGFKIPLKTWVYRIAINMVIQHQRKQTVRQDKHVSWN